VTVYQKLLYFTICILSTLSLAGIGLLAQTPQSTEVYLYFVDTDNLELVTEKRAVSQADNIVDQIKLTLGELIKGSASLSPTIPEETAVREVFLDEKGCAYIDFSRAISQNHSGGITGELITVASIVNTLTLNFPEEVRKVQILINGKEAETVAGHIDISKPIFPFKFE